MRVSEEELVLRAVEAAATPPQTDLNKASSLSVCLSPEQMLIGQEASLPRL